MIIRNVCFVPIRCIDLQFFFFLHVGKDILIGRLTKKPFIIARKAIFARLLLLTAAGGEHQRAAAGKQTPFLYIHFPILTFASIIT